MNQQVKSTANQSVERYIAVDFGAGSGRVIVGSVVNNSIQLEEIHRFKNRQIVLGNTTYWDFLYLFEEMKYGISQSFLRYGKEILSIGIDTWGVDYGLIDDDGRLIANPVSYRDNRTSGAIEKVFAFLTPQQLYSHAPNQFLEINTLFQLFSAVSADEKSLRLAGKLLFMPDLFNYYLTGVAANEFTIATTSQLFNASSHNWDSFLFETLNLPRRLMQPIVYPKTILGDLLPNIQREVGGNAPVITVGSHDTASAIASIEDANDDWAFISSGTWSLMGIKINHPIMTDAALHAGFTNEGTVDGKWSFLKNITGLWIIQSLLKEWQLKGDTINFFSLLKEAENCHYQAIIDVDAPQFAHPESMQETLHDYLTAHALPLPTCHGDYMRMVCFSLAAKYAEVKNLLEQCSGKIIRKIYIVGGGSQNEMLNKITAQLTHCEVIIGNVEATAFGNIMTQQQISNHK